MTGGIGSSISKSRRESEIAKSIGSKKHGHRVPESSGIGDSESSGQGNEFGYPTQYPLKYPSVNYGQQGGVTIDIDLTKFYSHVTRLTLTGDVEFTLSNPPGVTKAILIFFELTQDGTGGHSITWPLGMLPTPTVDTDPNAKTLIAMFSTDQGNTWHTQVFGASGGGGGSGDPNTPWTENQDAAEFDLLNLNKLHFKSTLNSLQITRGGGAGFDALDYEAVVGHQFFVNKSFNPTSRFQVLENSLQSNVDVVINDKNIEKVNQIKFGANSDEGNIDSASTGLRANVNSNESFRIRTGGLTRLTLDDLGDDLILTGLDVTMEGGRIFSVDDSTPGNALQMFVLFGEQIINAASGLRLQVAGNSFIEMDSNVKLFRDVDVQENDILNIKTAQIEEEFAAGFAPSGITDNAILFCRPDGSGKTELRVRFQTGNSILIAKEA